METIILVEIIQLNFETNLPSLLGSTNTLVFSDFGNVWGVDYDSSRSK